MVRGAKYSADFWMNNRWEKQTLKIEKLIEKFWPVPTWPKDALTNFDSYRNALTKR
jgi:hypothetical protein